MTELTTGIIVGVTAIATATAGGVYLGFSAMVMPALRGAPATEATATMNRVNVFAVRSAFLVAFLGSALGGVVTLIVTVGSLPRLDAVLAAVGAALALVAFVVTAAVNVPLNNRLAAEPAAIGFAGFERRWTRANRLRGTVSLVGAASLIGALVV